MTAIEIKSLEGVYSVTIAALMISAISLLNPSALP